MPTLRDTRHMHQLSHSSVAHAKLPFTFNCTDNIRYGVGARIMGPTILSDNPKRLFFRSLRAGALKLDIRVDVTQKRDAPSRKVRDGTG